LTQGTDRSKKINYRGGQRGYRSQNLFADQVVKNLLRKRKGGRTTKKE